MWRCPRRISTVLCIHEPACEPADCSGHGACVEGECRCTGFWRGPACDTLDCGASNCSLRGVCTGCESARRCHWALAGGARGSVARAGDRCGASVPCLGGAAPLAPRCAGPAGSQRPCRSAVTGTSSRFLPGREQLSGVAPQPLRATDFRAGPCAASGSSWCCVPQPWPSLLRVQSCSPPSLSHLKQQ